MANPTAFPRPGSNWQEGPNTIKYAGVQEGMSLLDYFAGQALVGFVTYNPKAHTGETARACYGFAKDMLKERIRALKELKDDENKDKGKPTNAV